MIRMGNLKTVISAVALFMFMAAAVPASVVAVQAVTVEGEVMMTDGGVLVLDSDEEVYILSGKDLTDFEGRVVVVTGTVVKGEDGAPTLNVLNVEPAE